MLLEATKAFETVSALVEHLRENETVAVQPLRVLGVERHELVEQNVGNRGHAHRGTRVTGVRLRGSIDLYSSYRQQLSSATLQQTSS
jgi:hypothetical protein